MEVYSPYKDKNLVDRQKKMSESGLGAVVKPIQQGADAFAGAMENSPVAAPMRRIMADRGNQQSMLATDERRKLREGLGKQFPEGREVFSNNMGKTSNIDPLRENQVIAEARGGLFPARNANAFTPPEMTGVQRGVQGVIDRPMSMTNNVNSFTPRPVNDQASAPLPNVRPSAMQTPGGWARNEQTGETLTVGQNRGDRIGAFGANGQPIDNITPLNVGNRSRISGGNYSFQGSPEAASRFNGAVSSSEYSPEAQSARNMQREQFLGRQGFEKVDPTTGMTPSQMRAFKPAERIGVAKMKSDAEIAREELGVNRMKAEGDLEVGRGNLANQTRSIDSQVAGAGLDMEGKQMTIDQQRQVQGLQKAYAEAKTPEERAAAERGLTAAGVFKPQVNSYKAVTRKLPAQPGQLDGGEVIDVFNERTGEVKAPAGGGQQMNFGDPADTAAVEHLRNLRKTNPKEYERLKNEWMKQG